MSRRDTVGIIGAGRFGTALAHVAAEAGRPALIYTRAADIADAINRTHVNPRLAEYRLNPAVRATSAAGELGASARLVVLTVNSTDVRASARALGDVLDGGHILVHAVGALVGPEGARVSDVLREETPVLRIGALAGPTVWRDLLVSQFTSMVVASEFEEVTRETRRLLSAPPVLRVYGGGDLVGVELASVLSNAYTLAVGMSDELDVGPGVRAVLVTRALAEASRLGAAAGAERVTFTGLAGLGNLLVRSSHESSTHSRDYLLGRRLGRGERVADEEFTEGARAALAGVSLAARLGVRTPVLGALAAVILGRLSAAQAAQGIADTVAAAE
ncbi:MAG: NAD(P)H-dependent glycerol-3-phosphate dehydrogenase [Haliangiales bacterium]